MKIAESLLNKSEDRVLRELQGIAKDNGLRAFAKVRLSDVLVKENHYLNNREFDYYTRSHCDFVVADANARPLMIIEYDGPLHKESEKQRERDEIKNVLCMRAGLGLLRINDKYVTKLYRGMNLLRWIVEVTELEKAFYEAQENGQIPWEEPFDPTFLQPGDSCQKFPYWLAASATQSFHSFFGGLDPSMPKGWSGIVGEDKDGASRRLSFLYFGDKVLWTKTGMRKQGLQFCEYDLLNQIDTCELGLMLDKFRKGEITASTQAEFKSIFERFCDQYKAHPSHSMGAFPFDVQWDPINKWRTK